MGNRRNVIILVSALLIITLICCAAGGVFAFRSGSLTGGLLDSGATSTDTEPSPTASATLFTRTPSPSPTLTSTPGVPPNMCDWAVVEGEEFKPNYTLFPPGAPFQKGWRVRNAGTCTWTKDYKVTFYSGRAMDAPLTWVLPQEVKPGESISIIFNAVAPQASGRHYGIWKIRNAQNLALGIGSERNGSLMIDLTVGGPSLTPDLTQTAAATISVLDPDMLPWKCDAVKVVEESIIPNSTVFVNATFTKLWRLKNIGGCTWSTGYAVVFESGSQMDAPSSQGLANPVAPGQTIDVYVKMKAPAGAGTYTGNWKMRSDIATLFGAGLSGNEPLKATVTVNAVTVQPATLTAASAKTNTSAAKTNTPVRTSTLTLTFTPTATTPVPSNTWHTFGSPTSNRLYDVNLVTPYDGWAVGAGGTTIRWNGTAWSTVASGTGVDLYAVSAVATDNIFAVGSGGTIRRWNGLAWSNVANPFSGQVACDLVQVRMIDASHGWIAGQDCGGVSASILRWDGANWTDAGYPFPGETLLDIFAVSDTDVWAYGTATHHWDGGAWNTVSPGVTAAVAMGSSGFGFGRGVQDTVSTFAIMRWDGSAWASLGSTTAWWLDNDMVGNTFGQAVGSQVSAWACGINGWNGVTWSPMTCPTGNVLFGVDIISGSDGWAVGDGGVILRFGNTTTPQATATTTPAPTLASIVPDHGLSAGGTSVVLTGTFLTGATSVTFGGVAAASFTVDSATQISAVTPAHAGGLVNVSVTTPGGTASLVAGYEYYPLPTITNVSPDAGFEVGGQSVVITGTGFEGPGFTTTSVSFGANPAASFTVDSATQITAVTPAGTGQVDVVVVTPGGTATRTNGFAYAPTPTISGVAPGEGTEAGGTSIIITGTDFSGAGYSTTSVTVDGTGSPGFTVDSPTQITAVTPPGSPGLVDVVVATPGGSATLLGSFRYLPEPTVTGATPDSGPEAGSTSVTLTGSGFQGTGITFSGITFGGVAGTNVVVVDANTVTVDTPAGTGLVDVVVTTNVGSATLSGGYEYAPPPTITLLNPDNGLQAGGDSIIITGTGFSGTNFGAPDVTLSFGAIPAASFTVDSASQITAVTPPAGAPGAVDVTINTPGGTYIFATSFTYNP